LKTNIIIPARAGSTRFLGKMLHPIDGIPVVIRTANQCNYVKQKVDICIATDSKEIYECARDYGYNSIMTGECLTGIDRCAEANRILKTEYVINVQGDEPLIEPHVIEKVIKYSKTATLTYNCYSYFKDTENPESTKYVKVVTDSENDLMYASRALIPMSKKGVSYMPKKQIGVYGFYKNQLEEFYKLGEKRPLESVEDIEILRFLENLECVSMICVDSNCHAVDYPEDIKIIEDRLTKG